MRAITVIPSDPQYKRAMICQDTDGVSLFLYTLEADSHCKADLWFKQTENAMEYCADFYDISEQLWSEIPDALPGCFDDFIHPVPIKPDVRKDTLIQAADGDIEWVKALLSVGTDPNGMPLIMAIQSDEAEIVRAMINSGADVNLDFEDTTPLIRAISSTNPGVVEILIKAGADVHKKASSGVSPLQVARQKNRTGATEQERKAIIQMLETPEAIS